MDCGCDCENCLLEKYVMCMLNFEEFERQREIKQSKAIAEYYGGVSNEQI